MFTIFLTYAMTDTSDIDAQLLSLPLRVTFAHLQVLERKCLRCQMEHPDSALLLDHMTQSRHMTTFVELRPNWDQPE